MNRLTTWARTVLLGHRRTLTDQQLTGHACALCGHPFTDTQPRVSYGWIGLPGRRHAYACPHACTVVTVDDTEDLFRAAIPTRQHVRLHHLGADDVPQITGPHGTDTCDQAYLDALDAQPWLTVVIEHPHGTLTTAPLPVTYAEQIVAQAHRLGYTATTRQPAEHAGSRS